MIDRGGLLGRPQCFKTTAEIDMDNRRIFKMDPLVGLIMLVATLVILYFLVKGLYSLATAILPVLIIATLIIDYKVYLDFGRSLVKLIRNNLVWGLLASTATFFLFPFVALFLFGKALLFRMAKSKGFIPDSRKPATHEDEYLDFEEVREEISIIELPPIKPRDTKVHNTKRNDYDDFFDE
jgi:hypothetical protein